MHPPEADMPSNAGYFTDDVLKSLEFCFVASPKNGSKFSATNPSQIPPHPTQGTRGRGGAREGAEKVHPPEADTPSNAGYFTDGVQKSQEFCFVASPEVFPEIGLRIILWEAHEKAQQNPSQFTILFRPAHQLEQKKNTRMSRCR